VRYVHLAQQRYCRQRAALLGELYEESKHTSERLTLITDDAGVNIECCNLALHCYILLQLGIIPLVSAAHVPCAELWPALQQQQQ
jgi:hypothetical protein